MSKTTPTPTSRASLCALGEYLRRHCVFAPLGEQVTIPQKTVKHGPFEKILDGLLGLLCGAKTISQSNGTIRLDPAVQGAFGRTGCAEQSTIAAPCKPVPRRRSTDSAASRGITSSAMARPHTIGSPSAGCGSMWMSPRCPLAPRPRAVSAPGWGATAARRAAKPSGSRRVPTAKASIETLLRGKETAVPALEAALLEVESHLGWTRERRAQIILRRDGGFGTTAVLNWLLSRAYQVVAKVSHSGRVRTLRQRIGPWQPTSSPGREIAAVLHPHRFCRTTRQWVIRTPKEKGGYQYAVLGVSA